MRILVFLRDLNVFEKTELCIRVKRVFNQKSLVTARSTLLGLESIAGIKFPLFVSW